MGISQYFTDLYFEGLDLPAIQAEILKVWEESVCDVLVHKLKLQDSVVDFMICNGKALVLEVNQFARTTGSGLFSWDEIETATECTIRAVQEPPIVTNLPPEWLSLI